MDKYAVIVAGGSGSRMKSDIPKQFLLLAGKPVLMHTIKQFALVDRNIKIVLVLPSEEIAAWESLIEDHSFQIPHSVVAGGATRVESVRNGLDQVPSGSLVAIHDGVRPLVSTKLINISFAQALENGSGVAAVNSKDSIRKIDADTSYNVSRSEYRLMQTPQTFKSDLVKEAFLNYSGDMATDDATIVEKSGHNIVLVEGEYSNLKITTPEDLVIAQALLGNKVVR
jgi:2-C-methyl-D-erythritol 4-phosphate cytidylyltransferase